MTSKMKKISLITLGISAGLVATTVASIALSSCTFQVVNTAGNTNSDSSTPQNPIKYQNQIN